MKTPVNSPYWSVLLQAIEDEVEEIHMTCDLLFPKTAKEVRHMMDNLKYHKFWIPKQVWFVNSLVLEVRNNPDLLALIAACSHLVGWFFVNLCWVVENTQRIDPDSIVMEHKMFSLYISLPC